MTLARRIVGSTALVAGSNAAARLIGLAAAPFLTSLFGPEPYGVMAVVFATASLITTLCLAGIDNSYARYYFSNSFNDSRGVEVFCWRFAIASSSLVTVVAVGLLWLAAGQSAEYQKGIVIAIGILSFAGVLRTMAETRRRLQGRYGAISAGLIIAGVMTPALSIFLGVRWRNDAWSLLLGALLGVLANVAALGLPSLRRVPMPMPKRLQIVSLGLPGVVTGTMFWALGLADRWILALFATSEVVGIYAFAVSLASFGLMFNSAVTLTWFPEATRAYESDRGSSHILLGRLWSRMVTGLLLIWLGVTAVGGDVLRLISDSRFHDGALYIPWIALGVFFNGVSSLANTGLMLAKNLRPAAYIWTIAALLSVVLNFVVIPRSGPLGAAIVGCIAYAGIAVGVMFVSQRIYSLSISWARLSFTGIAVLVCGVLLSKWIPASALLGICAKILIVCLISVLVSALMAPDWLRRAIASLGLAWPGRTRGV